MTEVPDVQVLHLAAMEEKKRLALLELNRLVALPEEVATVPNSIDMGLIVEAQEVLGNDYENLVEQVEDEALETLIEVGVVNVPKLFEERLIGALVAASELSTDEEETLRQSVYRQANSDSTLKIAQYEDMEAKIGSQATFDLYSLSLGERFLLEEYAVPLCADDYRDGYDADLEYDY